YVGEAAAREHEEEGGGNSPLRYALGHLLQVAMGERLDVGIGHRGGGALVLAHLGSHLVRGGDGDAAVTPCDQSRRLVFMTWICIGMEKHHGDGSHACLDESARV